MRLSGSRLSATGAARRDAAFKKPATGYFFNSDAGDTFTSLYYPSVASLSVSSGSIDFSSATASAIDVLAKDSKGNLLSMAFDDVVVDATYTVTSFPSADATSVFTGMIGGVLGLSAGEIKAHPASKNISFARLFNVGSPLANDSSGYSFSAPFDVTSRYTLSGTSLVHEIGYPSTAAHQLSLTLGYPANSFELPRLFSNLGVRFVSGVLALKSLKIKANYPNAKYCFIGDSITQGRFATTYTDAFAQKIRADYPGQVLVAGAPSATTSNWLIPIHGVCDMLPKYAFVMLGTNDLIANRPIASIQADYTTIVNSLITAGIEPIVLTCPPKGDAYGLHLNNWFKSQVWRYIDTYTLLGGGANTLSTAYSSGDGVHLNTAGNFAVYTAVKDYIVANNLN